MKLKETIMITIAALAFLLITGVAKADVSEVGTKVSNFIQNEVSKTKEYQKKVWSEANNKWPWNVLFKGKNDTQN
tara:strand:+ start:289 stop:513 length:225 start_codon:yes stop_codon:yes gene_type:complete